MQYNPLLNITKIPCQGRGFFIGTDSTAPFYPKKIIDNTLLGRYP
jgi:hypothetical protein